MSDPDCAEHQGSTKAPGGPAAGKDDDSPEALTAPEMLFVETLAAGESLADAAKAAGVSYRTARRWKGRPEIASAIRERTTEALALGRAVLASGMARAARGLVAMADGTAPAESPRVSACRAVVEGAVSLAEMEELEARLSELEARLESRDKEPKE
jgi:phage terminase small subunit